MYFVACMSTGSFGRAVSCVLRCFENAALINVEFQMFVEFW